jgi:predicted DNA repair protein MutK
MPSGLIALLDDVATIAKLAAASIDDVGLAAGKAGTKAAGVVIDDTAVTPRYVVGLAPQRELPIIGKIAVGSILNKLLVLLPAALLLTAFAPFLITPLLMIGGSYLAFEATEKITEKLLHEHEHEEQLVDAMVDPVELEKMQVKGAIRTDFILSAEIMAIALASLGPMSMWTTAARAFGNGLVQVVPKMLTALSGVGTAAMLWVGGGIILHGLEQMHILDGLPHALHDWSVNIGHLSGPFGTAVEWLVYALGSAVAGLLVGGFIVPIVRQFTKRPEELIVD